MSSKELTDPSPIGSFGQEEVRSDENHAAHGTAAEHEWGIQYQGPFESATDGSARAVRLHARALASTGVPVLLQSFTNSFVGPDGVRLGSEAMDDSVKQETRDLRNQSVQSLRLRIKHLVVSNAQQLRAAIIPPSVGFEKDIERAMQITRGIYDKTVVYSVWERSVIDPAVASILARVAECWVPCEHNKNLLQENGVERVVVVPHPWDPKGDMAKLVRRPRATDVKRFYAIGLWQPRKRFHETIGAFLLAFKPGDSATLTVKTRSTNVPGYPGPSESPLLWLKDPRVVANGWTPKNAQEHIEIFDQTWPESYITRLHFMSNIYVCASSGEAYCLPAFDAKVAGNRMILVGYNGARDFSSTTDPLIPYEMKPVPREYGWEENAMWAEARVEDIAKVMRNVEAPAAYERPPQLEACTTAAVGALMRARCELLMSRLYA